MGKFIDLTGERFGKLKVLHRDETFIDLKGRHRTMWRCLCDCGRKKSIRRDALTGSRSKSCGMCENDLTGKRFGRLTVLYKVGSDSNGHLIWKCRCDCGNNKDISATNLIQGYTQSCGCMHSEICSEQGEDLIGQKFGKLTVISLYSTNPRKFLCRCDCGGQTIVQPGNLKNGHTQSCGCINSLGEEKINLYLTQHNIHFEPEYAVNIDGMKGIARYDFALLDDFNKATLLIEYHGRQHYEMANSWHDNEEQFLERQRKDKLKEMWAKDNSIPLFVIPYWEFDNIEKILNKIIYETQDTTQND